MAVARERPQPRLHQPTTRNTLTGARVSTRPAVEGRAGCHFCLSLRFTTDSTDWGCGGAKKEWKETCNAVQFVAPFVGANKAKRAEGKSVLSLDVGGGEPAAELQLSSALQKKMQQHVVCQSLNGG